MQHFFFFENQDFIVDNICLKSRTFLRRTFGLIISWSQCWKNRKTVLRLNIPLSIIYNHSKCILFLQIISLPCKFRNRGCSEKPLLHKLLQHQEICPFRPICCDGNAKVSFNNMFDHMAKGHESGPEYSVSININIINSKFSSIISVSTLLPDII